MGVSVLHIQLEYPNRPVFAGELVGGHLLLLLTETIKVRNIRLRVYGEERTHVIEQRHESSENPHRHHMDQQHDAQRQMDRPLNSSTETTTVTVDHYGHHIIVDQTILLFGGAGGLFQAGEYLLEAGRKYAFPFRVQIPFGAPASCAFNESNFVRYVMECVVDRPWAFDYNTSLVLNVQPFIDCNQPQLRSPVVSSEQSHDCCCCWPFSNGGSIFFNTQIDHAGYAAGDTINFTAEINNQSGSVVRSLTVRLEQVYRLRTSSGFSQQRSHILSERVIPISVQANQVFKIDESVMVPPQTFPVTFIGRYIDVHYELTFSVDSEGCFGSTVHVRPGMVIGNVSAGVEPPRRRIEEIKSAPDAQSVSTAPTMIATGTGATISKDASVEVSAPPESEFWPEDEPPRYSPS